jgi:NADH-quinone oxidoreductase subunit N
MFSSTPPSDGPHIAVPSSLAAAAILVGVAATVIFGIMPQPLLDLAGNAGAFLR